MSRTSLILSLKAIELFRLSPFLKLKVTRIPGALSLTFLGLLAIFGCSANVMGQCPAVGKDTNCGIVIRVTDTGATLTLTGQPPYDNIEDTLVGVVNNSSLPVRSLGLSATLA